MVRRGGAHRRRPQAQGRLRRQDRGHSLPEPPPLRGAQRPKAQPRPRGEAAKGDRRSPRQV